MVIYTRHAVNLFYTPAETRMLRHINSAFWKTNDAMKQSKIPLVIKLDRAKMVSTGWGGVGQTSRHAEVFLRGGSDVAITL